MFSKQHQLKKLVWYETSNDVWSALEREKQIKSWKRNRKLELISRFNPDWNDLAPELGISVAQNR